MTSQTGQEIITIYIVFNISRNKGNQATKFCQSIKYNVTNILSYILKKWDREVSFWRLKTLVLWHKIVQNPLLFLYLFLPKREQLIPEKFHNSGKVGHRMLPDHSLNRIFNAVSIGVKYTLSFKWTNFGQKCLVEETLRIVSNNFSTPERIVIYIGYYYFQIVVKVF